MPFLAISLSLKTLDVLVLADTLIFKLAAGVFLYLLQHLCIGRTYSQNSQCYPDWWPVIVWWKEPALRTVKNRKLCALALVREWLLFTYLYTDQYFLERTILTLFVLYHLIYIFFLPIILPCFITVLNWLKIMSRYLDCLYLLFFLLLQTMPSFFHVYLLAYLNYRPMTKFFIVVVFW